MGTDWIDDFATDNHEVWLHASSQLYGRLELLGFSPEDALHLALGHEHEKQDT